VIALALTLVVLAVGFGAIERRWGAIRRDRRRGTLTDLVYWLTMPVISQVTAVIAFGLAAIGLALLVGGTPDAALAYVHRTAWFAEQSLVLQIALVLVVADFTGYWVHRAFHRGSLWRFHAIHHSSKDLDWLSSVRVHPINDIVQRALQALPVIALGFDPRVVAVTVPLFALYGLLLHANVTWSFGPLRYLIASPAFHRWHHTSEQLGRDTNFAGLFPIWDLVFRTYYRPSHAPQVFGVRDAVPDGFVGQMSWPFRRVAKPRATRATRVS
jgi:sterol desaturase/sphingolipid hydroxylase (fatty acid hydroxylase superfamily)